MTTTPALEARGVVFRIGAAVLVDGVGLAVAPGELIALVGPNGAGKSTLCALLAHDLAPRAGSVWVAGRAAQSYRARDLARLRAVLPQQPRFGFPFSVRDVVAMGRHPHLRRGRAPDARDDAAVDTAMEAADVTRLADRAVTELSGGEQTRVALARVLAQQAPILLLDEPTAALDLRHQQRVMRTCRALADSGTAVVAVLHDLGLAGAWADRIGLMHQGRMVACGRPDAVLRPEVVEAVFGEPVVVVAHPVHGRPIVVAGSAAPCTTHPPTTTGGVLT